MFGRGIFLFFLRKKLFLICKMETGEYIKALCSRLNAGVVDVEMCSGGGSGRRVWLRSIWSNPWGFKSPLEYHFSCERQGRGRDVGLVRDMGGIPLGF